MSLDQQEFKLLIKQAVSEVLNEVQYQANNESALINLQEAAALLNLAVATVYEKTSEKLIPHYKHGKKLMFKKSELLAWVQTRKIKSITEVRTEASRITRKSRS